MVPEIKPLDLFQKHPSKRAMMSEKEQREEMTMKVPTPASCREEQFWPQQQCHPRSFVATLVVPALPPSSHVLPHGLCAATRAELTASSCVWLGPAAPGPRGELAAGSWEEVEIVRHVWLHCGWLCIWNKHSGSRTCWGNTGTLPGAHGAPGFTEASPAPGGMRELRPASTLPLCRPGR